MTLDIIKYSLLGLEVLLSIACLILYIFKSKKIVFEDTAFEKVIEKLPLLVSRAEELYTDGSQKKSFVLSVSYAFLADLLGLEVDEVVAKYSGRIDTAIETILATPQKKGV